MKLLIIIRGVQGSGKSTLAGILRDGLDPLYGSVPHFEADMFFIGPEGYQWDATKIGAAHRWCEHKVNEAMKKEESTIIVSNTFVTKKEYQPYLEMAEQNGYAVQELICKGKFKNIHGVPEEKVEAKRKAFEY